MPRITTAALAAAAMGLVLAPVSLPASHAQNRMTYSVVSPDSGHVALGLAIRKLNVAGTFMQAPAHPDDETNALFALFTHGMGLRSIDLQNNRGEGGQNEIGPELFRDIGVLRTVGAARRRTASTAPSSTSRAPSTTATPSIPKEVIEKWGREEIVGDYVRLIRTLRPDVARDDEHPGRAAAIARTRRRRSWCAKPIARPAIRRCIRNRFAKGLRPWQPKKLYFAAGCGGGRRRARGGRGAAARSAGRRPRRRRRRRRSSSRA